MIPIPITRKELYLNKIVGNNDYETPEKPISEEELFFAEILGEAVQAPEPLTRYQMYLAKIAGRDIEIPYPETRLEYFLAKAAGMDITVPVPITREEIYWSNYTAIVEFEVEGVPPLTYKAVEGTLENYRIYGNTVGGESVGDRTGNLFDGELAQGYYKDTAGSSNDLISTNLRVAGTSFIPVSAGNKMTLSYESTIDITRYLVYYYNNNKELINVMGWYNNGSTITIPDNVSFIRHVWCARDSGTYGTILVADISNIMLNMGSTALPYEPYGYKVPVTVSNGTDAQTIPIYLSEQIRKVGDEAEFISYADQKLHRVGAEDIDVTLPELPTLAGTNVLTVGTAVQPSKVYIKGQKEREYS